MDLDREGYVIYNNIPVGTLVIEDAYNSPGICIVEGKNEDGSYNIIHIETNKTKKVNSDNLRIIVQFNIEGIQYHGIISGYSRKIRNGVQYEYIYVSGINEDAYIVENTYDHTNALTNIFVVSYDDYKNVNGYANYLNNIILNINKHHNRDSIIDRKYLDNMLQWRRNIRNLFENSNYQQEFISSQNLMSVAPNAPDFPVRTFGQLNSNAFGDPNSQGAAFGQRLGAFGQPVAPRGAFGDPNSQGAAFGQRLGAFGQPVAQNDEQRYMERLQRFEELLRREERNRSDIRDELQTDVQKEERLDNWIKEENTKIIITPEKKNPITQRVEIQEVSRYKTIEELKNEQKSANILKQKLLTDIKNEINVIDCLICLTSFKELSSEKSPSNEIYSCKNFHLVCGKCKEDIDKRKIDDANKYLWSHKKTPIWKCPQCRQVSKTADRLIEFENEYAKLKKHGGSNAIYKKTGKKEILGKIRIIYKMKGSNKEYINNKGVFMHITEYKNLKKKKGGMNSVAKIVSKVFKNTKTKEEGKKEGKEEKEEGNKEPQATSPNLDIVDDVILADVGYAMRRQPPPPPSPPDPPLEPQPQLNAFGKSNQERNEIYNTIVTNAMLGLNPSVSITNPRKPPGFSELYPELNPEPKKTLSELYRTK